MKSFAFIILCLIPVVLCWDFPGYPGVDCPTAAEKIRNDTEIGWMVPKCNSDGTFQDLQCYDQYPDVPDTCMCCAPDGTSITLPGFGLNTQTCVCILPQYEIWVKDHDAEQLKCENSGYYAPLQCSRSTGECWCVDKYGNVLVPPSKDVHSCDN